MINHRGSVLPLFACFLHVFSHHRDIEFPWLLLCLEDGDQCRGVAHPHWWRQCGAVRHHCGHLRHGYGGRCLLQRPGAPSTEPPADLSGFFLRERCPRTPPPPPAGGRRTSVSHFERHLGLVQCGLKIRCGPAGPAFFRGRMMAVDANTTKKEKANRCPGGMCPEKMRQDFVCLCAEGRLHWKRQWRRCILPSSS